MSDAALSENLCGGDLEDGLNDAGFEIFRDKETLKSQLIDGDVLVSTSDIQSLDETIDIIYVAQFLHIFGWNKSIDVGTRVVKLLKPRIGVLICGDNLPTI